MKLGYVCTNYNNSALTIAAVRSLLRGSAHEHRIVVVDNASRLEELAELRPLAAEPGQVLVIENPVNAGYFRGLNIGLRELRTRWPEYDWIVVGNNDLDFPPDFTDTLAANVSRLVEHSVISPDIVTLDGQHQNPHVISTISGFREIVYDLYYSNYVVGRLIHGLARLLTRWSDRPDEQAWQTARSIYQGHGSCYVLGPRFFAQFAELWAPTFMMHEEYFLSKQLLDVGEQVYYEPRLRVTHLWHGSLAKLPGRARWNMARAAHREYRKYVKAFR